VLVLVVPKNLELSFGTPGVEILANLDGRLYYYIGARIMESVGSGVWMANMTRLYL
jgi:hypothetical protein